MAEGIKHNEAYSTAKTHTVEFKAALSKKPKALASELAGLGLTEIRQEGNSLFVASVDSTDIDGNPHGYFQARFSPLSSSLAYTVGGDESPAKRKAEAAAWFLHLISSSSAFSVPSDLMQFVSLALSESSGALSIPQGKLFAELSALKEEHASLKARHAALATQQEEQSRMLLAAKAEAESLSRELSELRSIPPDVLDTEVLSHLRAHGGKIDISNFSKIQSIRPALVEESLGRLAKGGYIARIR